MNRKLELKQSQAGVTLLLAILLLAAILAISFSLTTILFIEVRSSADLLKTEGALYGAGGVGEQAIFALTRKISNPTYTSQFTNNVVLNGQPVTSSTTTPIFTDRVLAGLDFDTTTNKYDFCGSIATTSGCSFGKVTVNYIITNDDYDSFLAYLCQWDPSWPVYPVGHPNNGDPNSYETEPCTVMGPGQDYWLAPTPGVLNTDGSVQVSPITNPSATWNLNSSMQQMLIVANPDSSNDTYFSISTFASDGVTPKGLPLVGQTAITVEARNGAVGRKIQVVVPD